MRQFHRYDTGTVCHRIAQIGHDVDGTSVDTARTDTATAMHAPRLVTSRMATEDRVHLEQRGAVLHTGRHKSRFVLVRIALRVRRSNRVGCVARLLDHERSIDPPIAPARADGQTHCAVTEPRRPILQCIQHGAQPSAKAREATSVCVQRFCETAG